MGNVCAPSAPIAAKSDVDKFLEEAMEEDKKNLKVLLLGETSEYFRKKFRNKVF